MKHKKFENKKQFKLYILENLLKMNVYLSPGIFETIKVLKREVLNKPYKQPRNRRSSSRLGRQDISNKHFRTVQYILSGNFEKISRNRSSEVSTKRQRIMFRPSASMFLRTPRYKLIKAQNTKLVYKKRGIGKVVRRKKRA